MECKVKEKEYFDIAKAAFRSTRKENGMGYDGSLEEVIKQFCDEKWGMIPGETTASRFAKKLEWFRGMVKEYAEFFGKTDDEMVAEIERSH